jgi:Transposase, Mutator family
MAIREDTLDQLLDGRDPKEVFNKDGSFDELKKAPAERVLNAEIDDYLDSEAAEGRRNHRNGYSRKKVITETSKLDIRIPRDREGTFDPHPGRHFGEFCSHQRNMERDMGIAWEPRHGRAAISCDINGLRQVGECSFHQTIETVDCRHIFQRKHSGGTARPPSPSALCPAVESNTRAGLFSERQGGFRAALLLRGVLIDALSSRQCLETAPWSYLTCAPGC